MYEKILVTLDGTQPSESVLTYVEEYAQANDSEVILLTVLPDPKPEVVGGVVVTPVDEVAQRSLAKAEQYLRGISWRLGLHDVKTKHVVKFGDPAKQIAEYVRHNDVNLIAMVRHERHGLERFTNPSVTGKVMRSVKTPIFLLNAA